MNRRTEGSGDSVIPEGWIVSSEFGKPYYYNTVIRAGTWVKPTQTARGSVDPTKLKAYEEAYAALDHDVRIAKEVYSRTLSEVQTLTSEVDSALALAISEDPETLPAEVEVARGKYHHLAYLLRTLQAREMKESEAIRASEHKLKQITLSYGFLDTDRPEQTEQVTEQDQEQEQERLLNAGFETHKTDDGETFYYEIATKKSLWELPDAEQQAAEKQVAEKQVAEKQVAEQQVAEQQAAVKIQAMRRGQIGQREVAQKKQMERSASKIQSLHRGNLARKEVTDKRKEQQVTDATEVSDPEQQKEQEKEQEKERLLNAGFEMRKTEDGEKFYYETATGKSFWFKDDPQFLNRAAVTAEWRRTAVATAETRDRTCPYCKHVHEPHTSQCAKTCRVHVCQHPIGSGKYMLECGCRKFKQPFCKVCSHYHHQDVKCETCGHIGQSNKEDMIGGGVKQRSKYTMRPTNKSKKSKRKKSKRKKSKRKKSKRR